MRNAKYVRYKALLQEVESFLKQKGTKRTDGSYDIPKNYFLETLVDTVSYEDEEKGLLFEYNLLNKRLNYKFESTFLRLNDVIDKDEFLGEVILKICETLEDKDTVHIDFVNYKKNKDTISQLVFLIDTELHREILEKNGILYMNTTEKEVMSEKGYEGNFYNAIGKEIRLDDIDEETGRQFSEYIGNDDVISSNNDAEDLLMLEKFVLDLNLTKRQREVLEVLVKNKGNRTHTAEELGINNRTLQRTIERIQDRVLKNFGHSSIYDSKVTKQTKLEELDELLDSDWDNDMLIKFFVDNSDEPDINNLIYEVEIEQRKPFIRHMITDKPMFNDDKESFLMSIMQLYYKNK